MLLVLQSAQRTPAVYSPALDGQGEHRRPPQRSPRLATRCRGGKAQKATIGTDSVRSAGPSILLEIVIA